MTPERQVLYALVSAAFALVTGVLAAAAAMLGISPPWWTATIAVLWLVAVVAGSLTWRRTGRLLTMSIGLFFVWTIGTLVTSA